MGRSTFSGNSSYYIDVDASVQSQNFAGNYSTIYWRVYVVKTYGDGFSAWGGGNSGWADGPNGGGRDLWDSSIDQYDFRNGSYTGTFTMASGTYRLNHDSDGSATYYVNAALTLTNLGTAQSGSGTKTAPKFNRATKPPAPKGLTLTDIQQMSMVYRFSSTGTGGSAITEWQIGYGLSSSSPQLFMSSTGTSTVSRLMPGKRYYFWSRGRNAQGWSPWSNRISAQTVAGAYVRVKGSWKLAIPYVRVKGVWRVARPYVRKSGTWEAAD